MKRLIILSVVILIGMTGVAQKRTYYDVESELKAMIGQNVVMIDDNLYDRFDEGQKLYIKELRFIPTKDKLAFSIPIIPMSIQPFCFTCQCTHCGYIYNMWNGDCGRFPSGCGACPDDGYPMQAYVQACAGSPCGNIIGMK